MRPRSERPKQMNAANANGTHGWMGFAPGWVFCRSRASAWAMTRITIGTEPVDVVQPLGRTPAEQ